MKNRDYKIFRKGEYYHIFNRGNNKDPIFLDDQDYLNYLKRIKLVLNIGSLSGKPAASVTRIRPLPNDAFSIVSYILVPNHFHFIIKQNTDLGIDKFMLKLTTSYASYFNKKYNHIGNVFQDAFKAKLINNDSYLLSLTAYVHNNVSNPMEYPYSSFLDIIDKRNGEVCKKDIILKWFDGDPEKYKNFVLNFADKDSQNIQHLILED